MKLSILIPCLNEAKTIEAAVAEAKKAASKHLKSGYELIVADNGSTDGTLQKLSKIKKIKILNVPIKGYGAALHYGILAAKYPYVLFADADLSYNFDEMYKFLPASTSGYDLILGTRIKGNIKKGAMPLINRFLGTPTLSALIKMFYGINVSDCNSGMRMVKKSSYQKLGMKNRGMEWASELIVRTAINKKRYKEVGITFRKDKRGKKSHLSRWQDGWRHLKVIILLKPNLLNIFAILFLIGSVILYNTSKLSALTMMLFSELLFLSYLAAKKIESAIDLNPGYIPLLLEKLPLVLIGAILTITAFLQLIFIPDHYLTVKYIILSEAIIFDLWIFFIETIKTHLTNRLPSK